MAMAVVVAALTPPLGAARIGAGSIKNTNANTKVSFSKSSNPPNPQQNQNNNEDNNKTAFSSPEDTSYVWKLGAGSVAGAAVIKYGSILFPAITRPNLTEALTLILTPMLLSVLLLIRQSFMDQQTKDRL